MFLFSSKILLPFLLLIAITLNGCEVLQSLASSGPLDESTVAAGLKEALRVGTERAVGLTSQTDGFLANELIRIALPEKLVPIANALKQIGFNEQIESLEVGMNRAAELASAEATEVFWEAITSMSLSDAWSILQGHETAATDYFREKTSQSLMSRFEPIIKTKMQEVGLYQAYNQLMEKYTSIPFMTKPNFQFDQYIADQAMGGLFTMLAGEEKKIRENPTARTSELLRRVFSSENQKKSVE